ncbi:gephyrin-like molybdotransferase receptor GlpR [Streptomyces sp. HNM0574]|uniref:divisome protein SepX/GlpR n=1 Tax=Streptomyces sp. HNM0574 TaxID=2714954 RepID=UPI003217FA3F
MSSSGLIYAVIVGAWAAYLVPMWLRRQDELNEARPTERFSTAIRLLSGKAAMERRYAKDAERRETDELPDDRDDFDDSASVAGTGMDEADESDPDAAENAVDVRAFADPKTMVGERDAEAPTEIVDTPAAAARSAPGRYDGPESERAPGAQSADGSAQRSKADARSKRAQVLARRRRTTMVLFLAFTLGTVVAAVGGLAFLWAPAVPAVLLSAYIVHLRVQERRRFVVTMDRRKAEAAASRLHERRGRRSGAAAQAAPAVAPDAAAPAAHGGRGRDTGAGPVEDEQGAADRRALVEQTDHAEWVDQQRAPDPERYDGEGWDPVPVPLPTYVSAPVAPRRTRGVDLEAPDTWSSARSSAVGANEPPEVHDTGSRGPAPEAERGPRRPRDRRTPLFDQYEDEDRPRAANE